MGGRTERLLVVSDEYIENANLVFSEEWSNLNEIFDKQLVLEDGRITEVISEHKRIVGSGKMRDGHIYVTMMETDSCKMHETKRFDATFSKDGKEFFVSGKRHAMIEMDLALLAGDKIFVITESDDRELIKSFLLRREVQRLIEEGLEDWSDMYDEG